MKEPITTLPETTCKDCGNKFRFLQHSTIKPVRCQKCQNIKDMQVKKENNIKLLSRASFYAKSDTIKRKTTKDTLKRHKIKINGISVIGKRGSQNAADGIFSKYIRLKHSFESSDTRYCVCYTCGTPHKITEIQNGHWQRRGFITTRYNEDNCRPQCVKCNYHRSGEPEKFELHLIHDLGQQRVNELKALSQQLGEDNPQYYAQINATYRSKFNELLKQLGIKNPWKKKISDL